MGFLTAETTASQPLSFSVRITSTKYACDRETILSIHQFVKIPVDAPHVVRPGECGSQCEPISRRPGTRGLPSGSAFPTLPGNELSPLRLFRHLAPYVSHGRGERFRQDQTPGEWYCGQSESRAPARAPFGEESEHQLPRPRRIPASMVPVYCARGNECSETSGDCDSQ